MYFYFQCEEYRQGDVAGVMYNLNGDMFSSFISFMNYAINLENNSAAISRVFSHFIKLVNKDNISILLDKVIYTGHLHLKSFRHYVWFYFNTKCEMHTILQYFELNAIETLREKPVLFTNLYPIQTCYIH